MRRRGEERARLASHGVRSRSMSALRIVGAVPKVFHRRERRTRANTSECVRPHPRGGTPGHERDAPTTALHPDVRRCARSLHRVADTLYFGRTAGPVCGMEQVMRNEIVVRVLRDSSRGPPLCKWSQPWRPADGDVIAALSGWRGRLVRRSSQPQCGCPCATVATGGERAAATHFPPSPSAAESHSSSMCGQGSSRGCRSPTRWTRPETPSDTVGRRGDEPSMTTAFCLVREEELEVEVRQRRA